MGHRDQLLAAARRLLEERGYAHITARDLVAESDTNLASIGYHFGSKAALLNAAIELAFTDWSTQLAAVVMAERDQTPMQRAGTAWAATLAGMPERGGLLRSYVESLGQAMRVPELQEQLAGHYARARAMVAELTETALRANDPGAADDPAALAARARAVASLVIAACDGLAIQWMLDPAGVPAPEELADGLAAIVDASIRTPALPA